MTDTAQLLTDCGIAAAAPRLRLFATSAYYAFVLEPFGRSSHVIALSRDLLLVPTHVMLCGPKADEESPPRQDRVG
ncbi:hypothetical protein M446_3977 [Methylobacterium sp. 4-46]|uniref:hypothetical protein n=1 Tax=unclassified Methylobacterium TaxID=2615210 RepID=UPI000165C6BD|nr:MULTISPECIES: hypothetical protein [Methylobacterium]ACA18342.1 hypothetical protein M446_3977 [Methylobacterium sp. 4-46]WFT77637.1 hypothetical protein QA634_20200 [Methylobacterium nodulans]